LLIKLRVKSINSNSFLQGKTIVSKSFIIAKNRIKKLTPY